MKSVAVTPNAAVSPEPSAEPTKAPPFRMDMSVANSVASTPCACSTHILMQWLQYRDYGNKYTVYEGASSRNSLLRFVVRCPGGKVEELQEGALCNQRDCGNVLKYHTVRR